MGSGREKGELVASSLFRFSLNGRKSGEFALYSNKTKKFYYPTALRRVQITPKTSTNITQISTPEDRLDRFPAVDQSVSYISRANFVPLPILLSRIRP